jgi:hypothetical protein
VIHSYAARPAPIMKPSILPLAVRTSIPTRLKDPRAAEVLVDVRAFGVRGETYYAIADESNWQYGITVEGSIPDLLLRGGVAAPLANASGVTEAWFGYTSRSGVARA